MIMISLPVFEVEDLQKELFRGFFHLEDIGIPAGNVIPFHSEYNSLIRALSGFIILHILW
jgi:hypothetical protein